MNRIFAFAVFSVILILVHKVQGATIHWGNAPFDTLVKSDGSAGFDAGTTGQLGYFDGLVPDSSNTANWQSSFRVFDQGNFSTSNSYFTGSANLNGSQNSDSPNANPSTVFPENAQAYVWISNGGVSGSTSTEWALLTNAAWDFPNGATHAGTALEWKVSDTGTVAVFGDLGDQTTPGVGTMMEPGGPFTIQTATFPIPEPSASLLLLLGTALLCSRRHRETFS